MEQTLCLIKPDGVKDRLIGKIIDEIYGSDFTIVKMKMFTFTVTEAATFYIEHLDKPFFYKLLDFMISGPCVAIVLEKENAVEDWRKLIGCPYPEDAERDTIRARYGRGTPNNVIHGSDSEESAQREMSILGL